MIPPSTRSAAPALAPVAGTAPDGTQQFCYVHDGAYAATQAEFEQCQATFDPNAVAALLQVRDIVLACV